MSERCSCLLRTKLAGNLQNARIYRYIFMTNLECREDLRADRLEQISDLFFVVSCSRF